MAIRKEKTTLIKKQVEKEVKHDIVEGGAEREHWIEESAYYKAQARGFSPGNERQDWHLAEQEYDQCAAIE
ncbi:MAG: DUF2934 domain-containing protein [Methylococcales bacterium]|nr:DUF2934 domain-containing protein [Methylococcales bacterium]